MNTRILLLTFVLSLFTLLVNAGSRTLETLEVDNTFTMVQSDYQTIVDYVNANLSNTHDHPANSDDYYGASAYYSNFDARDGSYSASFPSSEDAIREALITVLLPTTFPSPNLNESFKIEYATYNDGNYNGSMRFFCSSLSPLIFTAIMPVATTITMDSIDYQFIVDYVNSNLSNTHEYSATAENHYGATAYYKNFDARDGSYSASFSSSNDAIKAAFIEFYLPNKEAGAIENDTFTLIYDVYTGIGMTDSMTFLCTSESPLNFSLLGEEDDVSSNFDNLYFGTDTTLDVITWNIEHFPKNGTVTMANVKDAIVAMNPEVIAFQEIDDTAKFRELVDELDDYEAIIGDYGYAPMCYIYKTTSVQVNGTDQLFEDDWSSFPREPLVLDLTFEGEQFIIICNHLKCCGDGVLDTSDSDDEENRRLNAIKTLKEHIDNTWSDKNVIVVGDFNDVLEDSDENNVFKPFIDDSNNYVFADMSISYGSSTDWSYPSWPSDLDHILISNELFDRGTAQTIKVDEHIGWATYDSDISDHRPVGLRVLKPEDTVISNEKNDLIRKLSVCPNPVNDVFTISGINEAENTHITFYNNIGQELIKFSNQGESSLSMDVSGYESGNYFVLIQGGTERSFFKVVKR